ncbi:MAG: ATPase domain-containing protein [Thermoplasmata archaeon]
MKRIKSGINGFDVLCEGGLPEGSTVLVSGPAGSAKSLFGLEFIYRGAKSYGETGILILVEEPRQNLYKAARRYNFEIERFEKENKIMILDIGEIRARDDLVDFSTLKTFIDGAASQSRATRIVVDSLSGIGVAYSSEDLLRKEMFKFVRFLTESGFTSVLISEAPEGKLTKYDFEKFLVDGLVFLNYENVKGEYRRTLTIYKMRFTRHDPYKHPFIISKSGIEIDPEEVIF